MRGDRQKPLNPAIIEIVQAGRIDNGERIKITVQSALPTCCAKRGHTFQKQRSGARSVRAQEPVPG